MFTLLLKKQDISFDLPKGINCHILSHEMSDSLGRNTIDYIKDLGDDNSYILCKDDCLEDTSLLSLLTAQEKDADIVFLTNSASLSIDNLDTPDLLNIIKEKKIIIPSIISFKKEAVINTSLELCRTYEEIVLNLIFSSVINGYETQIIENDNAQDYSYSPNNNTRSRMLQLLIQNVNIEELFPNNSWDEFSLETAAVAYHTLCALFIKFEDYASAKECLKLSSKFEDSPRALALRGIIALKQNEDLNAVANIVSSLHIYEKRKKETNHLENFQPQSFDRINTMLNDGLSALNKRDNKNAAKYFLDAVLNFDDFFKKYELDIN